MHSFDVLRPPGRADQDPFAHQEAVRQTSPLAPEYEGAGLKRELFNSRGVEGTGMRRSTTCADSASLSFIIHFPIRADAFQGISRTGSEGLWSLTPRMDAPSLPPADGPPVLSVKSQPGTAPSGPHGSGGDEVTAGKEGDRLGGALDADHSPGGCPRAAPTCAFLSSPRSCGYMTRSNPGRRRVRPGREAAESAR